MCYFYVRFISDKNSKKWLDYVTINLNSLDQKKRKTDYLEKCTVWLFHFNHTKIKEKDRKRLSTYSECPVHGGDKWVLLIVLDS